MNDYVALPLAYVKVCPTCRALVIPKKTITRKLVWVCRKHGIVTPKLV